MQFSVIPELTTLGMVKICDISAERTQPVQIDNPQPSLYIVPQGQFMNTVQRLNEDGYTLSSENVHSRYSLALLKRSSISVLLNSA